MLLLLLLLLDVVQAAQIAANTIQVRERVVNQVFRGTPKYVREIDK